MSLAAGHSVANRGSVSVPIGRKFAITCDKDCSVSISVTADAILNSNVPAQMVAGIIYICYIPAGSPPVFLSGLTKDPNGDSAPAQITFIDSGASGI